MKIKNFLFFIIHLFDLSFTFIPIWNIEKSSIDLTPQEGSSTIKTIYENTDYRLHAVLTKNITKINSEIKDQNYIRMLDGEKNIETNWKDIDQSYFIENLGHFVCAKGKNYLNQYKNQEFEVIKPSNYTEADDWELICFNQTLYDGRYYKWLFQGFLNIKREYSLFGKAFNDGDWVGNEINRGLFDFLKSSDVIDGQKYNMYALVLRTKGIYLYNYHFQIWNYGGWNHGDEKGHKFLDYRANDMKAYFDHKSKYFYWMTSNGTTDEITSGFSTKKIDLTVDDVDYQTKKNEISPLIFLNEVNLDKLELMRNTRFIYYEVSEKKDNNAIYRGVIDIEINQVILNTNEKFTKFETLTNYSIFAIKDNKAYEICFINYNGKCVNRCPDKKIFVLNNIDGNHCESTCGNYTIKPNDVCIDYCNNTIYSSINDGDKKICGFCKDINPKKPYKIINKEGCLEEPPYNTYVFNKEYYLLDYCPENCKKCSCLESCDKCEDGYELINGKCGKCYVNCEKCSDFNGNEDIQYCTKCKKNLYFFNETGEGNCLDNCPNGTYNDIDICSKCHENCKTCTEGPKDKHENCKTCEDDQYLVDAKEHDYDKNCVYECPNGTSITNISGVFYCTIPDIDEDEKDSLLSYIYIIIFGACLFIMTICIYKNICSNKKNGNELIAQIHTELQENNKLID